MIYDLIILGAGPAGLYAGFQAGLRQINAIILEALPLEGGQLTTFYPDKPIYDIPGLTSVRADELVVQLTNQWRRFQSTVPLIYDQVVTQIESGESGYKLITNTGTVYQAKYICLASGSGLLSAKRLAFEDPHIHYAMRDLNQFNQQDVLVLGGGDSALDWANTLLPRAKKVTLVHRRTNFRALETSVNAFNKSGTILTPYDVKSLIRQGEKLHVTLSHLETKEILNLVVDDIVVCYGFVSAFASYQAWGLNANAQGITVNSMMETSREGVFAVGNAATYPGKSKTIASAFGEVTTVFEVINHRLHPGKKLLYSSFLKF
jgi:thioredoxin reductase (NADPH)